MRDSKAGICNINYELENAVRLKTLDNMQPSKLKDSYYRLLSNQVRQNNPKKLACLLFVNRSLNLQNSASEVIMANKSG